MDEEELRAIFCEVSAEEPLAGGWPNLYAYGKAVAEVADARARRECAAIAGSMAERPFDLEPELSEVLAVEAAILATLKKD